MEKYRSTADPSTGVHPFLPPRGASAGRLLVGAVLLAPLRLLLAAVGAAVWVAAAVVVAIPLGWVSSALARPAVRAGHAVGGRALLAAAGVRRLPRGTPAPPPPRGGPTRPTSAAAAAAAAGPCGGDLLIASHGSILDVAALAALYSPLFTAPTPDGTRVVVRTAPGAAADVLWAGPTGVPTDSLPPGHGGGENLSAVCARGRAAGAPVVVWAEGTTSNGRGVLAFLLDVAAAVPADVAVYAVGFGYADARSPVSAAYTVGNPAAHLFSLLTSPSTPFRVTVTRLPRGAARDAAAVHRAVATAARLPPLRVGVDARRRFGAHWAATVGGGTPRAVPAAAAIAATAATTTAAGRGGGGRDGSAGLTAAAAAEAARPRKRR
ncbi:hypothetical protein MMPV_004390 [Pyropia vietnamensis]